MPWKIAHAKPHARGSKISLSSIFIILDIMGDHRPGKSYKSSSLNVSVH